MCVCGWFSNFFTRKLTKISLTVTAKKINCSVLTGQERDSKETGGVALTWEKWLSLSGEVALSSGRSGSLAGEVALSSGRSGSLSGEMALSSPRSGSLAGEVTLYWEQ